MQTAISKRPAGRFPIRAVALATLALGCGLVAQTAVATGTETTGNDPMPGSVTLEDGATDTMSGDDGMAGTDDTQPEWMQDGQMQSGTDDGNTGHDSMSGDSGDDAHADEPYIDEGTTSGSDHDVVPHDDVPGANGTSDGMGGGAFDHPDSAADEMPPNQVYDDAVEPAS